MFLYEAQRTKEKMSCYKNNAYKVEWKSRPKTSGIINKAAQCQQQNSKIQAVFNKQIVELHTLHLNPKGFSGGAHL